MPLLLALSLAAQPPSGPLPSALYARSSTALALVELVVPMDGPGTYEARWARGLPKALANILARRVELEEMPPAPELRWPLLRSCQGLIEGRNPMRVLLLVDDQQRVERLPQATFGLGLEGTPGYEQLREALIAFFSWPEERMRAAGPETLWKLQRAALTDSNPVLRHLSAEFLIQHGAENVVDEVWGAKDSEGRRRFEEEARVAPSCQPKPKPAPASGP